MEDVGKVVEFSVGGGGGGGKAVKVEEGDTEIDEGAFGLKSSPPKLSNVKDNCWSSGIESQISEVE